MAGKADLVNGIVDSVGGYAQVADDGSDRPGSVADVAAAPQPGGAPALDPFGG